MANKSYESQCFVDELTRRYHCWTGKYPTKEEAILAIRYGRRIHLPPPRLYWSAEWAKKRTFSRFVALELIDRIQMSQRTDPIRVIYELYDHMDDILCGDENSPIAWEFARSMKESILEVIDFLN